MFKKKVIGLEEARIMVDAVLKEAMKKTDEPVAIAVIDDCGRMVFFARMDGTPPVAVDIAINKAYTSAMALIDTSVFQERDKSWGRELATYGDENFTYIKGGLAIQIKAEPDTAKLSYLGGIAVSGRMPDEDERLAGVGLKQLENYYCN
jgi:glc operon protein GlcG